MRFVLGAQKKMRRVKKGGKSNWVIIVLTIMLLATIVISLFAFLHVSERQKYNGEYFVRSADLRVLSQQTAKYALSASKGEGQQAFKKLKSSRDRFEEIISELIRGNKIIGLPPTIDAVQPDLEKVNEKWNVLKEHTDNILLAREPIGDLGKYVDIINDFIPQLQKYSGEISRSLVDQNASQKMILLAANQQMLVQRIQNNVRLVLAGGNQTSSAVGQFGKDAERFGRILEGMLKGDKKLKIKAVSDPRMQKKLREVAMLFSSVNDNAELIIDTVPDVLSALDSATQVTKVSDKLGVLADDLGNSYKKHPGFLKIFGFSVGLTFVTVMGIIAFILMLILAFILIKNARQREKESKIINDRNQEAILRLLDEMGDLADGDLTVEVTVSEDITGAIADSINYAIEALRSLVTTIKSASEQVTSTAQQSRATALALAESTEHQAEHISVANKSIKQMGGVVENMSSDAKTSAEVAQRSLEIASKGGETVQNTINGMDSIREHIQETSKRIKRLGESSQEIGDIVELIDDISDQTNILALNAAMQAAMAGEAGRGFAVVADEVQRLAERSSNATKQIEALVKTIQADTGEAVASMEASTAEVVNGAKLAENSGEALKEIEKVSEYIAELTSKIAGSAETQTEQSKTINTTMTVIEEITQQTRSSTSQTASSIDELAEMANELGRSVAGFSLPE